MHSRPRHQIEVSGELHALAALPPGKEPLVPTESISWGMFNTRNNSCLQVVVITA